MFKAIGGLVADYCTKEDLRLAIMVFQKSGVMGERLLSIVGMMINGVVRRYYKGFDREEVEQQIWLHFVDKDIFNKADYEKNLFAFFTTVILNCLRSVMRKQNSDALKVSRLLSLGNELLDSSRRMGRF